MHAKNLAILAAVGSVLVSSLGLGGCAVDPDAPSSEMHLRKACLKTRCDENMESGAHACSSCLNACSRASYDCDSSRACEQSCSDRTCSDDMRSTCVSEGWKAVLPNNPDASILAACQAEVSHIRECGYTTQQPIDCKAYAATERADVAGYYQCVASLPCEDLTNTDAVAACDTIAPSTFGDEICAALTAAGCPCYEGDKKNLDVAGAWKRPDVLDVARRCTEEPSCSDKGACLDAWQRAVDGR